MTFHSLGLLLAGTLALTPCPAHERSEPSRDSIVATITAVALQHGFGSPTLNSASVLRFTRREREGAYAIHLDVMLTIGKGNTVLNVTENGSDTWGAPTGCTSTAGAEARTTCWVEQQRYGWAPVYRSELKKIVAELNDMFAPSATAAQS